MRKVKYHFNPDTLSYSKIRISFKQRFVRIFTYFSATLALAIVYYLIFSHFFDSPKEKALIRENGELRFQVELMGKRMNEVSDVLTDLQERDDNLYRAIFGQQPIALSVREAGFGGINRYKELEKISNSKLIINTANKLDKLTKQIYIQSKSYDELIDLVRRKEDMLASIPAIQPISNKKLRFTASGWGWRIHPIYHIRKFHEGMDFTAPTGTEVYATGDGVVKEVTHVYRGYGNVIKVDHGYGYMTLYAHLSEFKVREGQKVKRGDIIGLVGNTGLSTAPHLHYEVICNGEKLNPVNFYYNDLSPEEYDKMIELSSQSGKTFD
jgi:murein DD-endopeptidase MepM/ murein hydrolase activator NlpD